ncbi:MAG: Thiamine pyrophosphate protein TPP binding domain protein [Candidatus Magasanikbacteria bacterium GW2011_GWA2_37_8]|uniref:Thiamine pyrophosphate protein TPP binding domain protein n=1 Tax=Candidatus Magasanikbacteria bacterium GW2011_GWA2_37_8 TaxID=1619036 RepID=A0A0G0KJB8_9BACT|nr:MAG: Thiamine pyrophosphate protein TPP binding domain protein [Candidatus Magasanikbacteria bacterium GW2011_GWA2_37_8]
MIQLSDYVMNFLAQKKVEHIFMVSGGGGMFLIDSLGRSKDIKYVCNHHEQASVMSAEGYQRVDGKLGVALVTTGPAATNAITGVVCAWNDSIPLLVLSGQANSNFLIGDTKLRQRGTHEVNIKKIVESVTKYAVTVTDENTIRYHLEKAYFLAHHGRPGPVWLDIPVNIQSKNIDVDSQVSFSPEAENILRKPLIDLENVKIIAELLKKSKRPIIIAGHGIKLGKAEKVFLDFIENYQIPIVTTKNAFDLVYHEHKMLAGRIGTYGQRSGNFAVQNSDLVLSIGARLPFTTVGYQTELFARDAKKIIVDIDPEQLKYSTIKADIKLEADCVEFVEKLDFVLNNSIIGNSEWLEKCAHWRKKYPAVIPEMEKEGDLVNSYYFFKILSNVLEKDDIVVTDQGASFYASTVAYEIKPGQKLFTNGGFSPMGYGLPAAIGACFANNNNRVISVNGDGGLELNIQELQTIVHYNLPIKLFVFNNQGYLSIKHTQNAYFDGFFVGCDASSGVSLPDFKKIATAYGMSSVQISNQTNLAEQISEAIKKPGPMIIEIMMDPMQPFMPRVTTEKKADGRLVSKPLEDMWPFLDREEFKKEMIIKPVEE